MQSNKAFLGHGSLQFAHFHVFHNIEFSSGILDNVEHCEVCGLNLVMCQVSQQSPFVSRFLLQKSVIVSILLYYFQSQNDWTDIDTIVFWPASGR